MNKKICAAAAAALAAILTCSCSPGANPVQTDDKVTTAATETTTAPKTEDTELKIHSISELNTACIADSHALSYKTSSLELNYRESTNVSGTALAVTDAIYPRIKQMQNGNYIMFYQSGQLGSTVWYMTTPDITVWGKPRQLFAKSSITNALGASDTRLYMTCDACVLENGDILAVASFRASRAYQTSAADCGLVTKRSSDNGQTWSEEKVIYLGQNWEPYVLQLRSGEVQVYFTHIAPMIYLYGFDTEKRSSGTALLRSYDNGETWTPEVTEAPYAAYRISQYYIGMKNGQRYMTDQMPCAVELHNGKIALALEEHLLSQKFNIALSYSSDNWAHELAIDEAGPTERINGLYANGCAPYLVQLESGETVLSYNLSSKMNVRVGSASANDFGTAYIPFEGSGYWANLYADGTHSVIASMPDVIATTQTTYNNLMMVGRLYLNHDLVSKKATVAVDGNTESWEGNNDALFVGSDSQAQVSFRFAEDENYLYVLAERLDKYLAAEDSAVVFVDDGSDSGYYKVEVNTAGDITLAYFNGKLMRNADADGIIATVLRDGSVDDMTDKDNGSITEIAIPKSLVGLTGYGAKVTVSIKNTDAKNLKAVSDTLDCIDFADKSTWINITFE